MRESDSEEAAGVVSVETNHLSLDGAGQTYSLMRRIKMEERSITK